MIDLRDFVRWITDELEPAVRLEGDPGLYARCGGGQRGELYGISDMVCILHTLGRLDASRPWRAGFEHFTDAETGMILEKDPTHSQLHNTAFALGAMNLLGLKPARPPKFLDALMTDEQPETFLAELDWREKVYSHSHNGAGLAAVVALTVESGRAEAWMRRYFDCCDAMFDPANGMMGRDKPPGGDTDQIGGTFHYAFMYEHYRRAMPCPAARIDSVLALQLPEGVWSPGNRWWLTLDGIYLLTRSVEACGHRDDDVRAALRKTAACCADVVLDPAAREKTFGGHKLGVHQTTAAISVFAELQRFLGNDEIMTDRPLRLVLDTRPFI